MSNKPRTKIVCTMGPSTEDDEVLREMIRSGMTVARLNFSHGTHDYHRKNIERVRRIADELGTTIAILTDTKGPEIRTGTNRDHEPFFLKVDDKVVVTTTPVEGTSERFFVDYAALPSEVSPGSTIYIDDGLIGLEVERVEGSDIVCRVINGGFVGEHKGVNIPNVGADLPSVTERDRSDIKFSCEMGVDAIAASFVRNEHAVIEIRELCQKYGRPDMQIFSKIESSLGVSNLDSIIEVSDGIMVARGDLGVEVPPAELPHLQKEIIMKCNYSFKPVITATQMLDSMTHNPRPTRAEVTDVANAILDGTDCVMLSAETAAGRYPVESVRMMAEVCRKTEPYLNSRDDFDEAFAGVDTGLEYIGVITGFAAVTAAQRIGAAALLCPTLSGTTARVMSAIRPKLPILATSPSAATIRRTNFYWGVQGILSQDREWLSQVCYNSMRTAKDAGLLQSGDIVVITAGDPLTSPNSLGQNPHTNVCMISQVL